MQTTPLVVTDPRAWEPSPRALDRALLGLINDSRDLPFVRLSLETTLLLIPAAVYLFLPGRFTWWLGALYVVFNVAGFMDRYILMLHNTSHRPLFKHRYRWLNKYIPWVLGPFFGETPDTYYAHHIGMHHPENNLADDLSSTMAYQRDSFLGWLRYYLRFFFLIIFEITVYHARRRRFQLIRRMLSGELGFYVVTALLMAVNWRAALVTCVAPFVVSRTVMMMGNWAQHAFIDPADPANPYKNSLTVINCRYNRRCFNDGYHIGHHVKATRHWTEMATDFERNTARYAAEDAIVFDGIDFLGVWMCLMLKRYDWLAKRYVQLGERKRTLEEIESLLRSRTKPIAATTAAEAEAA